MVGVHEGGCLCGSLRYQVSADPLRVAYCHCRFCQRSSGAGYLVEPFFEHTAFEILAGVPRVYHHRSSGSGLMVHLHFCESCGTKTHTLFERYPGTIGIMGGTFDEPDWFEPAKVTRHVFTASARIGTIIPPGVNTYQGAALSLDGQPNTALVFDNFHVVGDH
jgi:hypothetical protein